MALGDANGILFAGAPISGNRTFRFPIPKASDGTGVTTDFRYSASCGFKIASQAVPQKPCPLNFMFSEDKSSLEFNFKGQNIPLANIMAWQITPSRSEFPPPANDIDLEITMTVTSPAGSVGPLPIAHLRFEID